MHILCASKWSILSSANRPIELSFAADSRMKCRLQEPQLTFHQQEKREGSCLMGTRGRTSLQIKGEFDQKDPLLCRQNHVMAIGFRFLSPGGRESTVKSGTSGGCTCHRRRGERATKGKKKRTRASPETGDCDQKVGVAL